MLHRARHVLLVLLACVPLVTAGPAPPQDDGGSGGDAPNVCHAELLAFAADDGFVHGHLHPPRDGRDYYGLVVDADEVNHTVVVNLDGHQAMTLDVFTPDCGRNVVAESPPCAAANRCAGHANVEGSGHERCDARGHQGDEACDTEQGERSELGTAVSFVPSQEGTYVVLVAIRPNTAAGPPTSDAGPSSCHLSCMDYRVESSSFRLVDSFE